MRNGTAFAEMQQESEGNSTGGRGIGRIIRAPRLAERDASPERAWTVGLLENVIKVCDYHSGDGWDRREIAFVEARRTRACAIIEHLECMRYDMRIGCLLRLRARL